MFTRHLPPSANQPRILVLDAQAAASFPPEVKTHLPPQSGVFDAVVGYVRPDPTLDNLEAWYQQLRPSGRLILAAQAEPKSLLEALRQGGFIHCLVESQPDGWILYRGERPPDGVTLAELSEGEDGRALEAPFFFIPVTQTPNKPVWRLEPDEKIVWQAPTRLDPASGQPNLLVFSSLLRAVAFMQRAVLANTVQGINKVGKFPNALVKGWGQSFLLNPTFHVVRGLVPGPSVDVDPQVAITGDE
jgi:hypothetical protein